MSSLLGGYLHESLDQCRSQLTDQSFKSIIDLVFQSILEENTQPSPLDSVGYNGVDQALLKQVFAAFSTVILEAAKTDAEASKVLEAMEECKVGADRAKYVASKYESCKSKIRSKLAAVSLAFPRVTGVDWRLDYVIKSNSLDRIDEPVYFLNLKLKQTDNTDSSLKFSASLQQLQDMHAKVLDATKAVERILNQKHSE